MKTICRLALAFCLAQPSAWPQESATLSRGHVVFECDFEKPDALDGWTGAKELDAGCQSARSVVFDIPAGSPTTSLSASASIPVERIRGYVLHLSAMAKAENVSDRAQPYHGIRFSVTMETPNGKVQPWFSANDGTFDWKRTGSFDWKRVTYPVRVPADATSLRLNLLFSSVTGKVWFDNIKVTVQKPPFVPKPPRAVSGPVYKGHDLSRLRGANVSMKLKDEDYRVFAQEWNANLVRWELMRRIPHGPARKGNPLDLDAYEQWFEESLKKLDAAVASCERHGLCVVVAMMSPPGGNQSTGGYTGSNHGLFSSAACQKKFVEAWERIARRYQNSKAVWGYDLANEPREDAAGENLADWNDLAEQAARAIRAIDPLKTIIVEPGEGGQAPALRRFQPLDVPGVVYSVHMYLPMGFTNQGASGDGKPVAYPGQADGKTWDRAELGKSLKPAFDFQTRHGVRIFCGEFNVVRWAPTDSANRYLKDLVELFEAHDWDWTYYAFRGWEAMDMELVTEKGSKASSPQATDRQTFYREWFAKNQKPSWYREP